MKRKQETPKPRKIPSSLLVGLDVTDKETYKANWYSIEDTTNIIKEVLSKKIAELSNIDEEDLDSPNYSRRYFKDGKIKGLQEALNLLP